MGSKNQMDSKKPWVKLEPEFREYKNGKYSFKGFVGKRIKVVEKEWLLKFIKYNPAIFQIFKDKERKKRYPLDAWSGEYPGKFLTGLTYFFNISNNPKIMEISNTIKNVILSTMGKDGYIGPFSRKKRLYSEIKKTEYNCQVWDLWGHYHCIYGLLNLYKFTKNEEILEICEKASDFIIDIFSYEKNRERLYKDKFLYINMSFLHVFCLLYKVTGNKKYLDFTLEYIKYFENNNILNYLTYAIEGIDLYKMGKPRWEVLHYIRSFKELYLITGENKYKKAFKNCFWSIVKNDLNNNGGITIDELFSGKANTSGVIETCPTVSWLGFCIDMLEISGDSYVADILEITTFNAILGALHESGGWWTYNNPLMGYRKASFNDIAWQGLPGGPFLNCCSAYGHAGLGIISLWSVMKYEKGIVLNYYGEGDFQICSPSGQNIKVSQKTRYPLQGDIRITISLERAETFNIKFRIPYWSKKSKLIINNEIFNNLNPGQYFELIRNWDKNSEINLSLGLSFHSKNTSGKDFNVSSFYYGPVLLTYDQIFNEFEYYQIPPLNFKDISFNIIKKSIKAPYWILVKADINDIKSLILCDYASSGRNGTYYSSLFKIKK